MRSLKNNFSKNARHLLLMTACFIMSAGLFSCSNENINLEPSDIPTGTDDASLIAWQMNKHFKTRANSYNIALITTKASIEFTIENCTGDFTINWGDGTINTNIISHTYTDNLPAHTIFIYGDFEANESSVNASYQEIIFADISGAPNLVWFLAYENRLTNIDLSRNTGLVELNLNDNNLSFIDVSNNLNLRRICIAENPIKTIDVTMLSQLWVLQVYKTSIDSLDVLNNPKLVQLMIHETNISNIDLSNNGALYDLTCNDTPISVLDLSMNPNLKYVKCQNTNITNLDISNNHKIWGLNFANCNLTTFTYQNIEDMIYLDIRNTPIEQDRRKMTNLILSLPDRNNISHMDKVVAGYLWTDTPYFNSISPLLEGYNWIFNPANLYW